MHASSYRKQRKDYSTMSTQTVAQRAVFLYCLTCSLDGMLHPHSHYQDGTWWHSAHLLDRKGTANSDGEIQSEREAMLTCCCNELAG